MGVRDGRNESKALFCRNKAEGKCDTPNMPYEEEKLLQQVADFRWEEYFGDPKHDAERAAAAADVERLALVVNRAQGVVDNLKKSVEAAVLSGDGTGMAVQTANRLLPEKEEDLNAAELQHSVARRKLENLRRRRTGGEASKDAKKRIKDFIKTGRQDKEQRREFNLWMKDQSLTFVVDLRNRHADLCIARYEGDEVVDVMASEWIVGHLQGEDRDRYLQDMEKFKQSGKRPNATEVSPEEMAEAFKQHLPELFPPAPSEP